MKKIYAILPVSLCVLLLAGCSAGSGLASEVETAAEQADATLALSTVATDDVTEFLVVCPYESKESVTDRLGFDWNDAPDYALVDDRQTIAFITDGRVSARAELSRGKVDFCRTGQWTVLPVDASLGVTRSGEVTSVAAPR